MSHELAQWDNDQNLYLFTSLTAGSSHIVTATSRIETILRANRLHFTYIDTGTNESARKLYGRRGRGKKLPLLIKEGEVIGDLDEIEELNEFGELKDAVGKLPPPGENSVTTTPAKMAGPYSNPPSNTASPAGASAARAAPASPSPAGTTLKATSVATPANENKPPQQSLQQQIAAEAAAKAAERKKKETAAIKASLVSEKDIDALEASKEAGLPDESPTKETATDSSSRSLELPNTNLSSSTVVPPSPTFPPVTPKRPDLSQMPMEHRGSMLSIASAEEIREVECANAIPEEDEDEDEEDTKSGAVKAVPKCEDEDEDGDKDGDEEDIKPAAAKANPKDDDEDKDDEDVDEDEENTKSAAVKAIPKDKEEEEEKNEKEEEEEDTKPTAIKAIPKDEDEEDEDDDEEEEEEKEEEEEDTKPAAVKAIPKDAAVISPTSAQSPSTPREIPEVSKEKTDDVEGSALFAPSTTRDKMRESLSDVALATGDESIAKGEKSLADAPSATSTPSSASKPSASEPVAEGVIPSSVAAANAAPNQSEAHGAEDELTTNIQPQVPSSIPPFAGHKFDLPYRTRVTKPSSGADSTTSIGKDDSALPAASSESAMASTPETAAKDAAAVDDAAAGPSTGHQREKAQDD